ncbi:MAG: HAMP domain-containing histidine kinase [Prevotella sp.]|nr:HAMP domain-containing histidine kinase [Prevotella sp.]
MVNIAYLLLLNMGSLMRLDILVWLIGIPIVFAFIVYLIFQVREHRQLKSELVQLAKIKKHDIEHELVLKAMCLSTWRYDVSTATFTMENDYRKETDSLPFDKSTSMDVLYKNMKPQYLQEFKGLLADIMEGRKDEVHIQYEMVSPSSEKVYWSEIFATVDKRNLDGKPLTIIGTTRRIDEQKHLEEELIEARNHAEESDRLKSAFLANITHEVRTPLNAIVGFSDVLPMAQSEEERNELVKLIKQNNAHLLRLFDDMMTISKLEAGGNSHVENTDFEILPLLRELVDKYMTICMEKGLDLFLEESAKNDVVHTDHDRLKEILNQYLNNAVKFTTEGSISIGYDKLPNSIRLWVSDTGKGIPEDMCNDHLFERFVKVDEFIPGTGLGLSICRSLALSINGKVGVESVLGKGSTFWVELPT